MKMLRPYTSWINSKFFCADSHKVYPPLAWAVPTCRDTIPWFFGADRHKASPYNYLKFFVLPLFNLSSFIFNLIPSLR
jgi:hypothetical protein